MLQKLKMRRSTESIPVLVCTAAVRQAHEMEGYLQSKGIGLVHGGYRWPGECDVSAALCGDKIVLHEHP